MFSHCVVITELRWTKVVAFFCVISKTREHTMELFYILPYGGR